MNWKSVVIVLLILSATTAVATATASLNASELDPFGILEKKTPRTDHLQLQGDPLGDPTGPHSVNLIST